MAKTMLKNYSREKLINAIIYFTRNTRHCYKTKLFKLLYFLDFEHYKDTGRSVTGLTYYAWEMGPVPRDLYHELKHPGDDLRDRIALEEKQLHDGKRMLDIQPQAQFDGAHFSNSELRMRQEL